MSWEGLTSAATDCECWKITQIDLQRMQDCADSAVEKFRRFLLERFEHVFLFVDTRDAIQREDEVTGEVICLGGNDRVEGPFTLLIGDLASGGGNMLYFSENPPDEDAFKEALAFLQTWMREPANGQLKLIFDCSSKESDLH